MELELESNAEWGLLFLQLCGFGKIVEFFETQLPHLQCPNYYTWLFPIQSNGNKAI